MSEFILEIIALYAINIEFRFKEKQKRPFRFRGKFDNYCSRLHILIYYFLTKHRHLFTTHLNTRGKFVYKREV